MTTFHQANLTQLIMQFFTFVLIPSHCQPFCLMKTSNIISSSSAPRENNAKHSNVVHNEAWWKHIILSKRKWHSVSMFCISAFLTVFHNSITYDIVLIFIDRATEMVHFSPTSKSESADETAYRLYITSLNITFFLVHWFRSWLSYSFAVLEISFLWSS